jgi:photosystem II stability/assembly factor-like uncharacterized protein
MSDNTALLRQYMFDVVEPSSAVVDGAKCALLAAIEEEAQTRHRHSVRRNRLPVRSTWPRAVLATSLVLAAVVGVLQLSSSTAPKNARVMTTPHWRLAGYFEQSAWQVTGSVPSIDPSSAAALVCPTANECFATEPNAPTPSGAIVEMSHDSGRTWGISLDEPAVELAGLTCPTATTCVVTGEGFVSGSLAVSTYVTTNGGASWSTLTSPGGSLGSGLLSCSSSSDCVVATSQLGPNGLGEEYEAVVTTDGGLQWGTYPFPGPFQPYSLQCNGQHCVAVGASPSGYRITSPAGIHGIGAAAFSSDGGRTWSMGTVPTADVVHGLTCADQRHCFAVEETETIVGNSDDLSGDVGPVVDTIIETDDGGKTWVPAAGNEPDEWLLGSISCPTASDCWITGYDHAPGETVDQLFADGASPPPFVKMTDNGGRTWTSVPLPDVDGAPITQVFDITCVDAATCLALAQGPTGTAGQSQRQLVISTAP